MRLTSSHRRALGLLTAGTIGLSTALLGVAGVAHAAPGVTVPAEAEVAAVLAAPSAPVEFEVVEVGDGFVTVTFQDGFYDSSVEAETTGYEISTDDGSTWEPLEVDDESYTWRTGTVTGLTNKETYTIVVRATSTVGPGATSAQVTATPAKPIGAPAGLTVTTAAGKVDRHLVRAHGRRLLPAGRLRSSGTSSRPPRTAAGWAARCARPPRPSSPAPVISTSVPNGRSA